jgi:hypothetical protein
MGWLRVILVSGSCGYDVEEGAPDDIIRSVVWLFVEGWVDNIAVSSGLWSSLVVTLL